MPNDTNDEPQVGNPTPEGDEEGATTPAPQVGGSTPATIPAVAGTVDELPEWAQELISDLRGENAKHRTAKKAAEKVAQEAEKRQLEEQQRFKELYEVSEAKLAEAEARIAEMELNRLRMQVGAKFGLPPELIGRLQGENAEEIEADAKALLKALPKPSGTADGARGTAGSVTPPEPDEEKLRREAVALGVNPEEYMKNYQQI